MTRREDLSEAVVRALKNSDVRPGTSLLVACSGGRDSIALAHALTVSGAYDVVLAHVDHGIREAGSRREERDVVDRLAERLSVPLLRRTVSPGLIDEIARRQGRSLEETARTVRYRKLSRIARELSRREGRVPRIVTAHHRGDQFETIIMRLFSGRSPEEPLGIPVERPLSSEDPPVYVIRPLLNISPATLRSYVAAQDLPYIEDPTNADRSYLRNRVRADLVPMLERTFPDTDVSATVARFAEEQQRVVDAVTDLVPPDAWGEFRKGRWRVRRSELVSLPATARNLVLRRAVKRYSRNRRVGFAPFRDALERFTSGRSGTSPPGTSPAGTSRSSTWPAGTEVQGETTAGGLTLRWGPTFVELFPDLVRTGRCGYLWSVDDAADLSIRWTDGRVVAGTPTRTDPYRWKIGPVRPPVVVRPRREGDRIVYHDEPRNIADLLKRTTRSSAVRRYAPVLEDRQGIVAIVAAEGPLCVRDGVEYTKTTTIRYRDGITLSIKDEETGDDAERQ